MEWEDSKISLTRLCGRKCYGLEGSLVLIWSLRVLFGPNRDEVFDTATIDHTVTSVALALSKRLEV
jgi:hypothetical protein